MVSVPCSTTTSTFRPVSPRRAAATPAAPVAATPEKPKEAPVAAPKAAAEAPRALRDSEAPRQRRQPGERPLASPAVRQRARDLGIDALVGEQVMESMPEVLHGPTAAAALAREFPQIPADVIQAIRWQCR